MSPLNAFKTSYTRAAKAPSQPAVPEYKQSELKSRDAGGVAWAEARRSLFYRLGVPKRGQAKDGKSTGERKRRFRNFNFAFAACQRLGIFCIFPRSVAYQIIEILRVYLIVTFTKVTPFFRRPDTERYISCKSNHMRVQ